MARMEIPSRNIKIIRLTRPRQFIAKNPVQLPGRLAKPKRIWNRKIMSPHMLEVESQAVSEYESCESVVNKRGKTDVIRFRFSVLKMII